MRILNTLRPCDPELQVEAKLFTDAYYFEHGKQQWADYLTSEDL
jgi:hypothetical protein